MDRALLATRRPAREADMEFSSRQEVYRWSERTGFRGRQAVLIRYGGCTHRFVLDCRGGAVNLFYEGLAG